MIQARFDIFQIFKGGSSGQTHQNAIKVYKNVLSVCKEIQNLQIKCRNNGKFSAANYGAHNNFISRFAR